LDDSAALLGQIQKALNQYPALPVLFDQHFLSAERVEMCRGAVMEKLEDAMENEQIEIVAALKKRLRHLERVSRFQINPQRLTYGNSHGDYYTNQIIAGKNKLTVIDWTDACRLPYCFEAIMSFSYASPACKSGGIETADLKRYLDAYSKYITLSSYDLKAMPYFYYYQLATCTFLPPYDSLAPDYMEITNHCNKTMDWLYQHVDTVSSALCRG